MEFRSLRDLFIHELKDIYSAEDKIIEALPKLAEYATNSRLKDALYTHMKETESQINRLEEIFRIINVEPEFLECKGVRGLLGEAEELLERPAHREVMDAGLLAAAQRIEHFELSAYGAARTFARLLVENRVAEALQKTLDEENNFIRLLDDLAESMIHERARTAP